MAVVFVNACIVILWAVSSLITLEVHWIHMYVCVYTYVCMHACMYVCKLSAASFSGAYPSS
jgi:hypothetical protein